MCPLDSDLRPLNAVLREFRAKGAAEGLPDAALAGLTASSGRGFCGDGRVPALKVGREWFVRERDLPLVARALAPRIAHLLAPTPTADASASLSAAA